MIIVCIHSRSKFPWIPFGMTLYACMCVCMYVIVWVRVSVYSSVWVLSQYKILINFLVVQLVIVVTGIHRVAQSNAHLEHIQHSSEAKLGTKLNDGTLYLKKFLIFPSYSKQCFKDFLFGCMLVCPCSSSRSIINILLPPMKWNAVADFWDWMKRKM